MGGDPWGAGVQEFANEGKAKMHGFRKGVHHLDLQKLFKSNPLFSFQGYASQEGHQQRQKQRLRETLAKSSMQAGAAPLDQLLYAVTKL